MIKKIAKIITRRMNNSSISDIKTIQSLKNLKEFFEIC